MMIIPNHCEAYNFYRGTCGASPVTHISYSAKMPWGEESNQRRFHYKYICQKCIPWMGLQEFLPITELEGVENE